ncbi:polysaccharide biosynthesis tyrosine autokinase [Thauera phenolivorans]|uniref:polysaccharide biosynthesis tyrosine autokinase n=1 Tax=Thauera phenolivorans TaxID=1792543 RepID=UPI00083A15A8|nr:polysaccharide biosynthesis tyrosine autokinase [Thauera phenolivorans]
MTRPAPLQPQTSPRRDANRDDFINLGEIIGVLLDNKWLIAGVTAAFVVVGAGYATLATPIYRADALIQVEKKSGGIPGLSDLGDMLGAESKAVTEIELLKSRSVIGAAVDNLKLDLRAEPVRFPLIGNWFARRFVPATPGETAAPLLGLASFAWGGERIEVFRLEVPPALVGEELELVAGADGHFSLAYEDTTLAEGRVGEEVEANGLRIQLSELVARPGTRFNLVRRDRLATVRGYQDAVEARERGRDSGIIALGLADSDPSRASAVLDEISKQFVRQNVERMSAEAANSLEFLRGQLPEVRRELEKAEAALNTYQSRARSVDIGLETQAVLDQVVGLETQISNLRLQQAEYDRRLTREHPRYQALLTQLAELSRQKASLAAKVENLPETQQELLRYTRDVQVSTEIYTQLLNKAQELDVVRAGTVGNARLIDSAAVNRQQPVAPRKALIVLLSAVLGGLASLGLVWLRRSLNKGLETPEAIEQLGLPVYATVPFSEQQKSIEAQLRRAPAGASGKPVLLAATHPHDLAVESLRSLRTSLHFAMLEAADNRLMISGPSPTVGKTFVSANLAAVIAQAGQRVLLVDVDMRKGRLHKLFGARADNGLSDVLANTCTLDAAIHRSEVEGLAFIPRGRIPPNPSELLMHANFTAFLDEVGKRFDLVILDTPPLLAVTDAAIVGRQAGTSLIVTRFGMNGAREIELTVRRFAQNGIDIKGAIFNGIQKRAAAYGSYHYYQYEYKSEKA